VAVADWNIALSDDSPAFVSCFQVSAPTATSDRSCKAGTACEDGKTYQAQPLGFNSDRVCAPVTACDSSEEELIKPTRFTDRLCRPKSPPSGFDADYGKVCDD